MASERPSQWLTLGEAADRAGCHANTVRKLVRAGEVEARKEPLRSGFRYLVAEDALTVIAHKVAMGREASEAPFRRASQPTRVTGVTPELAEVTAERDRLRDEVSWLRVRFEEAQRTIAQLALPAAVPSPPEPVETEGKGFWARLWGR